MNQILYTGDKKVSFEINKIIKVFCIIIILFAIMLISYGTYILMQKNNNISVGAPNITATAEKTTVTININHTIAIDKIFYSWGNGEEMQINANGAKQVKENVELPNEDTVLNLRIIDSKKGEYKFVKEFKYVQDIDVVKPTVKLSSVPGNVIISVQDNKELSYIEYKWNNEKPVRIESVGEDKTKIEQQIEVREGKNKLQIYAIDTSGNSVTQEKEIETVTKPTITLKRSKGELIINVTDEEEVTKVVYQINGNTYTKENTGENKKQMEIKDLLQKGENVVKVTAYNKAGLTEEKIAKCTY